GGAIARPAVECGQRRRSRGDNRPAFDVAGREEGALSQADLDVLSPYGRFLHHCAQGELAYQRSSSGEALFFPLLVDPADAAAVPQWAISQGLGRVHSVTVVHHRNETPFALGLIDLDEGFRM